MSPSDTETSTDTETGRHSVNSNHGGSPPLSEPRRQLHFASGSARPSPTIVPGSNSTGKKRRVSIESSINSQPTKQTVTSKHQIEGTPPVSTTLHVLAQPASSQKPSQVSQQTVPGFITPSTQNQELLSTPPGSYQVNTEKKKNKKKKKKKSVPEQVPGLKPPPPTGSSDGAKHSVILNWTAGRPNYSPGTCSLGSACQCPDQVPHKCHGGGNCENAIHNLCAQERNLVYNEQKFFCSYQCYATSPVTAAGKPKNTSESHTKKKTKSSAKRKAAVTDSGSAKKSAKQDKKQNDEEEVIFGEVHKLIIQEAKNQDSELAKEIDHLMLPYFREEGMGYYELCGTALEIIRLLFPKDPCKSILSEDNRFTRAELSFNPDDYFVKNFIKWMKKSVVDIHEESNWISNSKGESWKYRDILIKEYIRVRGLVTQNVPAPGHELTSSQIIANAVRDGGENSFDFRKFRANRNEVIKMHTKVQSCLLFKVYMEHCQELKIDPKTHLENLIATEEATTFFTKLLHENVTRQEVMNRIDKINKMAKDMYEVSAKKAKRRRRSTAGGADGPEKRNQNMKSQFRKSMVKELNEIRSETNEVGCGAFGELQMIEHDSAHGPRNRPTTNGNGMGVTSVRNGPGMTPNPGANKENNSNVVVTPTVAIGGNQDCIVVKTPAGDTNGNAINDNDNGNRVVNMPASDTNGNTMDDNDNDYEVVDVEAEAAKAEEVKVEAAGRAKEVLAALQLVPRQFRAVDGVTENFDKRDQFHYWTAELVAAIFDFHLLCTYHLQKDIYQDTYDTSFTYLCLCPKGEDMDKISRKKKLFAKTFCFIVSQFVLPEAEYYYPHLESVMGWAHSAPTRNFFAITETTKKPFFSMASLTGSSTSQTDTWIEVINGFLGQFPDYAIPTTSHPQIAKVITVVRSHFEMDTSGGFPRNWNDVENLANAVSCVDKTMRLPVGTYLANTCGLASGIVCSKALLRFFTSINVNPNLNIGHDAGLRRSAEIMRMCGIPGGFYHGGLHKAIASIGDSLRWIAIDDPSGEVVAKIMANHRSFGSTESQQQVALIARTILDTQQWSRAPPLWVGFNAVLERSMEISVSTNYQMK